MRSGDHICVDRGTFMDHGIYVSREQVIHISAGPLQDSKGSVICSATLDDFAPGGWNRWVGVVEYRGHPHFSYLEVIDRAKSQLGKHGRMIGSVTPAQRVDASWIARRKPVWLPARMT